MKLHETILEGLVPTADEQRAMDQRVEHLLAACTKALRDIGLPGEPTVQGSVAKGTWLAGSADLDCFILMPRDTPEDLLKTAAEAVGERVLINARKKYAQHPYVMGTFEGAQVDLVPAYAVEAAASRMSAVDRTPFHTAWVREHLDDADRADVRLLKQWAKGVGIYGAETSQGGFSGYLLEVLVARLGGFDGVLAWFRAACQPAHLEAERDEVQDDVSPIIVADPVDPARNCAAAVQSDIIARAHEAAIAYKAAPTREFFHPPPQSAESADRLNAAMANQQAVWLSLVTRPATDRLDIVFPQFQKAARTVAAELERAGFPVRRHRVDAWDDDSSVGMQWMVRDVSLPAERIHTGPPADKEPNASGFRAKWDGHPDALGPVEVVDGRLQIRVQVPHRTPLAWLQSHLSTMAFGKHVTAAIGTQPVILSKPADASSGWAPHVADFILDRRPWQRPVA